MTLNGVMAIILRYFAEFGSFCGHLRKNGKSGRLAINRLSPEKCHKVHQLQLSTSAGRTRCALRGSRSFLFSTLLSAKLMDYCSILPFYSFPVLVAYNGAVNCKSDRRN